MNRRRFCQEALAGSALAGLSTVRRAHPAQANETAMPEGVLGRTGVRVSRLGLGCAQFGQSGRDITDDDVARTLHRALELGVNYFDAAPNYGDSEEKMGHPVKEIRDKIFLVSKTEEATAEGTWRLLRQSLKRLQTDRLDLVHLHNFGYEDRFYDPRLVLSDKGALGALREAKKQGVIRFIGASGHLHPSRFHMALDTGEIDVLMNAVNFVAQHLYDFEHKVWSRAREMNLGLVAMKVLGGDYRKGYRVPAEEYERAIRYALSIPGLSCAVIGMKSAAEVEQAARTVTQAAPMSDEERLATYRRGLELASTKDWQTPYGEPMT